MRAKIKIIDRDDEKTISQYVQISPSSNIVFTLPSQLLLKANHTYEIQVNLPKGVYAFDGMYMYKDRKFTITGKLIGRPTIIDFGKSYHSNTLKRNGLNLSVGMARRLYRGLIKSLFTK